MDQHHPAARSPRADCAEVAAVHGGVLSTRLATMAGITKAQLQWAVHRGDLVRLARGAYVPAPTWAEASPRERHLLRIRAAQTLSPESVAVAESAAMVWGLPLPTVPVVPRLLVPRDAAGGGGAGNRPHALGRRGWLEPAEVRQSADGIRATTPARTVVDCARHLDRPWSLALADAARRIHSTSTRQLTRAAQRNPSAPGHPIAAWVAEHAVRQAESPLESLGRAVVLLAGLPAPRPQVWLLTAEGEVRVDLLDPGGRVIIEADGRLKYTDPQTLWQEKLREDALRATGREVVRFTYRDYRSPEPWLTRYRAALTRAYGGVRGG